MVAPTKSLDDALDEIVDLAEIPEDLDCKSYFRNLALSTISDWNRPIVQKLKLFSDKSVASELGAVIHTTHTLLADLKTMEKGRHAENALGIAGLRLRAVAISGPIWAIPRRPGTPKLTIKHFIDQLELLAIWAKAAAADIDAHRSKRSEAGRPASTSASFDLFVHQLRDDARAAGGTLRIYKSRDQVSFTGSLLKAIKLLRAHLPADFVPEKAGLGRRLYRIVHGH